MNPETLQKIKEALERLLILRTEKETSDEKTEGSERSDYSKTQVLYFLDEKVSIDLGSFICLCEAPVHYLGKHEKSLNSEDKKTQYSLCNSLMENIFLTNYENGIKIGEMLAIYQQMFTI